ncbi:MAG: dihydrodipicolinate synthase family protein [Gammaproteobacteria bacterium]|nr:dihydrodipicolinate synthase family protein [Gammaproteobacteria bacterium]
MSVTQAAARSATGRDIQSLPAYGVWTPVLMPVTGDLNIDVPRFLEHARSSLDAGCHGLAIFGTTSEANSFSLSQRKSLLESALDAGLAPERLMVGTGCCALSDSIELTRHAVDLGCKKVLVLPPFYYKNMSDAGLFRSFAGIIDGVGDPDLRVYLYHFPQLSGVPITFGLIELLLERYPEVTAGIKDSSGDWSNMSAMMERFPQIAVFPGSENFMLAGLRAGGVGCITATANANAAAIRRVYDAWREDGDGADALNRDMEAVRNAIARYPLVPALKYLVARARGDSAWRAVMPPMVPMADADGEALLAALRDAGYEGP